MTKLERLKWLKEIEKDIYVCSLESTFADDSKSCAIHSIIEELEKDTYRVIEELEKVKTEFENKEGVFTSYHFVKAIEKHIAELKGDNNDDT